MKKAIVKLSDGTIYEYQNEYIWGWENELNDTRVDYVKIGNLTVKREAVYSIEIIYLTTNEECEVETNE